MSILLEFPTWVHSVILLCFGLLVGSFGNVLIHRLPQEEPEDRDVVLKGSHCPACKTPIKPWHNIPLLGWLWLRGKCAACGWRIPFRYPLVEGLTGLLFAASPWLFPLGTLIWLKGLIAGFALIVLFFTDFTEFMLPDAIQLPLIGLGLLLTLPQMMWPEAGFMLRGPGDHFFRAELWHNGLQPAPGWHLFGGPVTWREALAGAVMGYGVPALMNALYRALRKQDGIGMGDFKMLAWLGAFWGWQGMLGILFLSTVPMIVLGIPLALIQAARDPRREGSLLDGLGQHMLPWGCGMAVVTPLVVFFGPGLWEAYLGILGAR
ncbi:MAG TPA: prepilin peptidase [Holophagaceae bacterium]|nr:prepilin peptidase [Holophagaceae bacterium]